MARVTKKTETAEGKAQKLPAKKKRRKVAPAREASEEAKEKKRQAAAERKRLQEERAQKRKEAKEQKEREKAEAKAAAEAAAIEEAATSNFATYQPPTLTRVPLDSISIPSMSTGRRIREIDTSDHTFEEKVLYILANRTTLRPIDCRLVDGKGGKTYEVFAGCHRATAYAEANARLTAAGKDPITDIDVNVWDISINQALQLALLDNTSSRLMSKLEIAMAVNAYCARAENREKTAAELADGYGMKLGTFQNMRALGSTVPSVTKAIFKDGTVPASVGYVLGRLPEAEQEEWLPKVSRDPETGKAELKATDAIKAIQKRVREIDDGAEVGGEASRAAVEKAASGAPTRMSLKDMECMLNDLMNGDPSIIGEISLTAQSVAIDVYRTVLGLPEVNTAHWNVGFQGGSQPCVARDKDGALQ